MKILDMSNVQHKYAQRLTLPNQSLKRTCFWRQRGPVMNVEVETMETHVQLERQIR